MFRSKKLFQIGSCPLEEHKTHKIHTLYFFDTTYQIICHIPVYFQTRGFHFLTSNNSEKGSSLLASSLQISQYILHLEQAHFSAFYYNICLQNFKKSFNYINYCEQY